jgi:hemerythrin-like domain-containing protein
MRQCSASRQLAHEHQRAVAAAQRLEMAASGGGSALPARTRFLRAWNEEIVPHYRREEEILLPELAHRVSEADAVIVLTLADHDVLRRLVREISRAPVERLAPLAEEIRARLSEHVRFEEESLFPALEEKLGRHRLSELAGELAG